MPIFPFTNPLLEPFRRYAGLRPLQRTTPNELIRSLVQPRNRLIDMIFYNVEPQDLRQVIEYGGTPEGAIVLVSPDRNEPLRFFPDAVEFFRDSRSEGVGGVSVAGVGSSAVGAVGLARDVTNATGAPMAAIVAGYGTDDLIYEALGAWYLLREVNEFEL